MPPKAYFKQLPFLNSDDGIFDEEFIEDRRVGLEEFINKLAGRGLELDLTISWPNTSFLTFFANFNFQNILFSKIMSI